jgi:hypothetical protein
VGNHMQDVGREATGYTHFFDFVGCFNVYGHMVFSLFSVTWQRNGLWGEDTSGCARFSNMV